MQNISLWYIISPYMVFGCGLRQISAMNVSLENQLKTLLFISGKQEELSLDL